MKGCRDREMSRVGDDGTEGWEWMDGGVRRVGDAGIEG